MERRDLVGGGLAAGIAALMVPEAEAAAAAAQRDNSDAVSRALDELRQTIHDNHNSPWRVIEQVREQQRIFMRQNYRYPEFIDVGIGVWDSLHDWHVRFQQPVNMRRIQDGRYAMAFTFTTFILRPDMLPGYIGMPYDNNIDLVKPPL